MYYIYGVSVPSLLIESTDSMIIVIPSITVKKLFRNHHIVELDAHTIGNKAVYAPNRA